MSEVKNSKISDKAGKWLGWIAIILAVIGFFWQPIWMGVCAIVLSVIGLFSPQRTLNIVALIVGAVSLIVGLV